MGFIGNTTQGIVPVKDWTHVVDFGHPFQNLVQLDASKQCFLVRTQLFSVNQSNVSESSSLKASTASRGIALLTKIVLFKILTRMICSKFLHQMSSDYNYIGYNYSI